MRAGAAVGVTGLGLAGCSGSASPPPVVVQPTSAPPGPAKTAPEPTSTSRPAAKYGGVVRTGRTSVERTLDPHQLNGAGGSFGAANCYNQLLTYKWGPDVVVPSYIVTSDLAESWTQPDDLTYVFKLRQGVKWHNIPPVNGRELVADDILFSYDRIRELKAYAPLLGGISKQEAVDKYTVKLTLDKPNSDLLTNLANYNMKIVAKDAVVVNGNLEGPPVIGTGPWIFESWSPTDGFKAKRNPDYFLKGIPYADRLESVRAAGGDFSILANAFRAGQLNVITNAAVEAATDVQRAVPNAHVLWIPLNRSSDELGLNAKTDLFRKKEVRQAVVRAIDFEGFLGAVGQGKAALSSGLSLPAADWGIPEAELKKLRARDVAGARALLKQAGLESGFDFKIIAPNYAGGLYVTISELVQANLRDIGVRATIEPLDPVTYTERRGRGQFDAYIANNGTLSPTNGDLYARYYAGGSLNPHGYDDPELNKLIDQQAALARDAEARKKVLLDIQRKVVDDTILVNLMVRQVASLTQPEVMDWYPNAEPTESQYHFATLWFNK
jgi:peptide/nickel transport system substrate-binding protein